eukprot:NODE_2940_length_1084_cov_19.612560_g2696_i0.p1 GENE.NODE_2940_length_1084_cov_19.612560_g2696_i0~~NODE_2940_length_1084_cov_19.612560_g2696_i0.p1  ORF type:complete len:245 (-),score=39.76 NODE_2940_length_1084_cov_19.612560_g2696_i0:348-1004(-)
MIHGNASNAALVASLCRNGTIRSPAVERAMLSVDRARYCPHGPYEDRPQSIGYGVTISAPHMHAMCLELLEPHLTLPRCRVLDVGSGSGYLTAAMSAMADSAARVYGIEYIPELVPISIRNMQSDGKGELLESGRVTIVRGDGSRGLPDKGPFSAIHGGAAAPRLPEHLVEQLASPGRMVVPVGPQGGHQQLLVVDKDHQGNLKTMSHAAVSYVPLHM